MARPAKKKSAPKKPAAAKPAKKPAVAKPVKKPAVAKSSAKAKPPARTAPASSEPSAATPYTPQLIDGIGWAPFRYPL